MYTSSPGRSDIITLLNDNNIILISILLCVISIILLYKIGQRTDKTAYNNKYRLRRLIFNTSYTQPRNITHTSRRLFSMQFILSYNRVFESFFFYQNSSVLFTTALFLLFDFFHPHESNFFIVKFIL